jgi:ssDNA-binding Zn-finger/Zn-ribbon topoisomerase 1
MMEKTPSSVEIPAAADNAEESIKCPQCGAMFGVAMISGRQKNGALVNCPVCHSQIDPAKAEKLGASNEGY